MNARRSLATLTLFVLSSCSAPGGTNGVQPHPAGPPELRQGVYRNCVEMIMHDEVLTIRGDSFTHTLVTDLAPFHEWRGVYRLRGDTVILLRSLSPAERARWIALAEQGLSVSAMEREVPTAMRMAIDLRQGQHVVWRRVEWKRQAEAGPGLRIDAGALLVHVGDSLSTAAPRCLDLRLFR